MPLSEAILGKNETETNGREASLHGKLNWLRAGVLGANDGIVSVAGLVMGVAGATASSHTLLIAGLAGVVSGALSMAGGEYVSVSSQKDTEAAAINDKRKLLTSEPDKQLAKLASIYEHKGLDRELAAQVAAELSEHDALAAHAESDLGIRADELTSPWAAAFASFVAFALGAIIPLFLMVFSPTQHRVLTTLIGTLVALSLTGFLSATLGGGPKWRPMVRNVIVGVLGMLVTYFVGTLIGGPAV